MSLMAAATIASLLIGSRRRLAVLVGVRCLGGGGTDSLGEPAALFLAELAALILAELADPSPLGSPFRLGSVIGRRFSPACEAPWPALADEQRTALERWLTGTCNHDRTLFE